MLLFLFHPRSPHGPIKRKKSTLVSKNNHFLTCPFCQGKMSKLKGGHCRGPPPPHVANISWWHVAHILIQINLIRISPRVHVARFSYPDSLKERHTTLTNITSGQPTYTIWICSSGSLTEVSKSCTSSQKPAMAHVPPLAEWDDRNEVMASHFPRSLTAAAPPTIAGSRPMSDDGPATT